jgi:hypothetical protein
MRVLLLLLVGCQSPTSFTTAGGETLAERGKTYAFNFDDAAGPLPSSMSNVLGEWERVADANAPSGPNVLKQSGQYYNADFPRVLVNDLTFTNATVRVKCRPDAGDTDRACGLVFRAKDSDNYYLTRANALEGNVNFYKVVSGSRMEIVGANRTVTSGAWHTLEAETNGDEIVIRWDAEEVIRAHDDQYSKGKVGLWTKADSVTSFDDLEGVEN